MSLILWTEKLAIILLENLFLVYYIFIKFIFFSFNILLISFSLLIIFLLVFFTDNLFNNFNTLILFN